jgi:tRNA-dihydrouridine synthase
VSDWKRIAEAKKIANVPLLANGDILEPHQVKQALEITGLLFSKTAWSTL